MMNNMMNEMMNKMMAEMMPKMMEAMMASMMNAMMGSTTPEVAPAEVEPAKKNPGTLSKDDFLSITEAAEPVAPPTEVDFVVFGSRTARYNCRIPKDIWDINHIAITNIWKGKWSKKNDGYIFDSPAHLRNFLMNYRIKTELSEDDKKALKTYRAEKAQRTVEYYAKKAAEMK